MIIFDFLWGEKGKSLRREKVVEMCKGIDGGMEEYSGMLSRKMRCCFGLKLRLGIMSHYKMNFEKDNMLSLNTCLERSKFYRKINKFV